MLTFFQEMLWASFSKDDMDWDYKKEEGTTVYGMKNRIFNDNIFFKEEKNIICCQ